MTIFRPCIDLHNGEVKQIVGGSLSDSNPDSLQTNFISTHKPTHYVNLYKEKNLQGGHIIMLGRGNERSAMVALSEWPGRGIVSVNLLQSLILGPGVFHVGGGMQDVNAPQWISAGAGKVIDELLPDAD
jgi:phosphoribosylformimino-5-aminoimidazole carboxamide ribotide isomerase